MGMGENRVSGAKCGHAVFQYVNIRLSCLSCSRDKNLLYIHEMNIHDRREDHVPQCYERVAIVVFSETPRAIRPDGVVSYNFRNPLGLHKAMVCNPPCVNESPCHNFYVNICIHCVMFKWISQDSGGDEYKDPVKSKFPVTLLLKLRHPVTIPVKVNNISHKIEISCKISCKIPISCNISIKYQYPVTFPVK